MVKRFKGSRTSVLVAVALDERSNKLVDIASRLCRRTGMSLRLVHIVEPWVGRYWSTAVAGGIPLTDVVQSIETEQVELAEKNVEKLAQQFAKGLDCTTNVVVGLTADGLIADAVSTGAALIVCGTNADMKRFVPRGFSTALSLMSTSSVPVLVIPDGCDVDLNKQGCRIVVADDLSASSESVALIGYDLDSVLDKATMLHVHVNPVTGEDLQLALNSAMATSHSEVDPAFSAPDLMEMMDKNLADKLAHRTVEHRALLQASGGHYEAKLLHGRAAEELAKFADTAKADLVVFGRHQTLHRKPFLVGRVPFHAMLNTKRAVLVAPPIA